MSTIDVEKFLSEISPDQPAGENLEYDAGYLETLRLAEGTAEQQVGDEVKPAEDPNWGDLHSRCIDLFARTRDLRLAMTLMLASLGKNGLPGLRDGMAVLRGTVEQFWDSLYPQLDPEDDNDPLERMNILISLAAPAEAYGDPMKFQRRLREAALTESRQLGRFSLRDLMIARGELHVDIDPDSPPPELAVIEGAFEDTGTEDLQAAKDAVEATLADFEAMDAFITEKVGVSNSVDLSSFGKALKDVRDVLQEFLAKRGYGAAPGEDGAPGEEAAESGGPGGSPISGEVRSTQDVLLALDKICRYYELSEPSSPVPLLLKRAQRLVSKSFLEIIKDLSPDALNQIQSLGGVDGNEG